MSRGRGQRPVPRKAAHRAGTGSDSAQPRSCGPPFSDGPRRCRPNAQVKRLGLGEIKGLLAIERELERIKRLEERIEEESKNPELAPTVARLGTLRGVDTITAMTVVSEVIDLNRFASPRELMAFIGLVPRERSSGGKERRGSIMKTGNAHLRRVLIESAWQYQRLSRVTAKSIRIRRQGQPPEVVEIARKAERRLHNKYARMIGRGKRKGVAAVSVARGLAGFIWPLGRR